MSQSKISTTPNITGRDDYIMNKALSYAITTIENLPSVQQEASDCDGMCTLLEARVPDAAARAAVMLSARAHMGQAPFLVSPCITALPVVT